MQVLWIRQYFCEFSCAHISKISMPLLVNETHSMIKYKYNAINKLLNNYLLA